MGERKAPTPVDRTQRKPSPPPAPPAPRSISKDEISVLRAKPADQLTLAEVVFLQGLRIAELERKLDAHMGSFHG